MRRSGGTLWLMALFDAPLCYVLEAYRRAGGAVRELVWMVEPPEWAPPVEGPERTAPGGDRFGRLVRIGRTRDAREYPVTVTWVSPRLLWALVRAPEDVVIVQELNLTALFAVLSKLRGRRRVVALIEGDLNFLGRTGKARVKMVFRRVVARFVDVFVANGGPARRYLQGTLGVPPRKVVEGWWLAGLPTAALVGGSAGPGRNTDGQGPVFLTAGQLIRRKGIDLLIDGIARYRQEVGPCTLQVVGDGPERLALEEQARRLGIADDVVFLGQLPHAQLETLLRACDLFVFPTLYDLIGRVVVEALSVGTPVAVSCLSGAVGHLVRDGDNGLVMDPRDTDALLSALRRAADPAVRARLQAGARATSATLTPDAAAGTIRRGVDLARGRLPAQA